MRRPMTCPICGSKISRITNATTNNSYFRCSNRDCFFVLSEDYTDADFYLQGTPLETRCLKCGEPLRVASGPHGLYPRCFNCDCDTAPFRVDGKIFQKWANARREEARAEVRALEEEFNSKDKDDQLYDFEEFIANAEPKAEETRPKKEKTKKEEKITTNIKEILNLLRKNLKEPMTAETISKKANLSIGSVRTSLLSLRSLEEVKIVGSHENLTGNRTLLYQLTESPLAELHVYSKEDGYNSIASFLRENVDKYGSIVRTREVLTAALKNVEPELFQNTRGICSGYKISIMEEIMNSKVAKNTEISNSSYTKSNNMKKTKVNAESTNKETIRTKIINTMREDLNKPYTTLELMEVVKSSRYNIRSNIRDLKKDRKIKTVGWDYREGYPGSTALSYQLTESPLPRFKITTDNNSYLTLKQFYKKKLRGKRCISMKKVEQIIKTLPVTPILVNKGTFAGYAVSDLKEAFKEYLDLPSPKKARSRVKPVKINTTETPVSNPIAGRKSVFSIFSSLFKGKEKVHS